MGGIGGRKLAGVFIKSGVASLAMGIAVYVLNKLMAGYTASSGRLIELLALGLVISFGALIYFALIYIFKVQEIKWLIDMVKKRIMNIFF